MANLLEQAKQAAKERDEREKAEAFRKRRSDIALLQNRLVNLIALRMGIAHNDFEIKVLDLDFPTVCLFDNVPVALVLKVMEYSFRFAQEWNDKTLASHYGLAVPVKYYRYNAATSESFPIWVVIENLGELGDIADAVNINGDVRYLDFETVDLIRFTPDWQNAPDFYPIGHDPIELRSKGLNKFENVR